MKLLSIIILLFAVSARGQQIHQPSLDLTETYQYLMYSAPTSVVWPKEYTSKLRDYKVIFVPGFLSSVILGLGSHKLAQFVKQGQYYDEHMSWLKDQGVEYERVEYLFEGTPGENAQTISKAITQSQKPVIILAHSKGGLDTISALMNLDSESLKKVHGFLAIQVPFYGSPIADCFTEIKHKRSFAQWTLPQLNISYDALYSLKTRMDGTGMGLKDQTEFMINLSKSTSVISFASSKKKIIDKKNLWQVLTGQDTIMFYSRDIMERKYGLLNDGLVPVRSAVIPGSKYIVVENVDHAVPVMYCQILKFDRIRFLKTTLRLILEDI